MSIRQEIYAEINELAPSSLSTSYTYMEAKQLFGLERERNDPIGHNGVNKFILNDEDRKIEEFLSLCFDDNVDWNKLKALYPYWTPTILPKGIVYPKPKFRTKKEHEDIKDYICVDWELNRKRLRDYIKDEKTAHEYLIHHRWGDEVTCPFCGTSKIYKFSTDYRKFKCAWKYCRKKFTTTSGTVFDNTKISLLKWFEAMYLLTSTKTSKISTPQLAKALCVTQKTSWGMVQKIKAKENNDFLQSIRMGIFKPN